MQIVNVSGPLLKSTGDSVIHPGESAVISMKNRAAAIVVTVSGTAQYGVEVSQAKTAKIINDTATFIPVTENDYSATSDFYIVQGGFIRVVNRESSEDDIVVDWRV